MTIIEFKRNLYRRLYPYYARCKQLERDVEDNSHGVYRDEMLAFRSSIELNTLKMIIKELEELGKLIKTVDEYIVAEQLEREQESSDEEKGGANEKKDAKDVKEEKDTN